jgi:hypothetical protein
LRSHALVAIATGCLLSVVDVFGTQPQPQIATTCRRLPVEPCVVRHGRFSTQNGIAQILWLIGTTRRVDVTNELTDFLPSGARKYIELTSPDHSYIFGDFTICPIEPDVAGRIRDVCVTAAKNLVVQRVDGSRPPFRIRSTWSDERREGHVPNAERRWQDLLGLWR